MDSTELQALYDLFMGNNELRSAMSGDAIATIICVTIICITVCSTVLIWKWWDEH